METKQIHISDYNYALPDERIAKFPIARRDQSKLLVYDKGRVGESLFCHLPEYLPTGALMVFNNTKVIQARLHFRKPVPGGGHTQGAAPSSVQGALIEIFLLEPALPADYEQMFQRRGSCSWYCLVGNLKKWKEGSLTRTFAIGDATFTIRATRQGEHGTSHLVAFEWSMTGGQCPASPISFAEVIDAIGELPIPPYLNRKSEESDKTTYQTVYSKIKGSVAAPTAGLHFTPEVLAAIDDKGIDREELTLHVGAGTFKPVKSEDIGGHEMHTEYFAVHRQTLEKLLAHDCHAIAVGTTSVRTLESLYYVGLRLQKDPHLTAEQLHINQWEPYGNPQVSNLNPQISNLKSQPSNLNPQISNLNPQISNLNPQISIRNILGWLDRNGQDVFRGSTQIIIAPGYEYKIVNMLITNFHQPQSTLLLLVSAFVNGDWHTIYDYALSHDFRFLSYGDSSLLIP